MAQALFLTLRDIERNYTIITLIMQFIVLHSS